MATGASIDGRSDFDFLVGNWKIRSCRLRERLSNCTDWEEFDGTGQVRHILGGLGNRDEVTFNRSSGRLEGFTLRLFNLRSQEWNIYWADNQSGILLPPMIGTFADGIGEFYAQEVHQDSTVLSRFIWSGISSDSCHWEQALSADGGRTWETNWTMAFKRI